MPSTRPLSTSPRIELETLEADIHDRPLLAEPGIRERQLLGRPTRTAGF
jgi:hypothetical protein